MLVVSKVRLKDKRKKKECQDWLNNSKKNRNN